MRLMCLLSHWYITFRQRCPFGFNTHSDLFGRTYKRNTRNQPILDSETQFNISFLLSFQIVIRICLLLLDEKQRTSKIFISFFFFFSGWDGVSSIYGSYFFSTKCWRISFDLFPLTQLRVLLDLDLKADFWRFLKESFLEKETFAEDVSNK